MKSPNNNDPKESGISLLLIAHLLCCGLPLLIISLGSAGLVVVLGYMKKSLVPGGIVLAIIAFIWAGRRLWKRPHR